MLKALIRAGVSRMLRMDSLSNALITIGQPHHEIHEGGGFVVSDVDLDIDTASPKYWRILTPAGDKHGHFTAAIWVDKAGLVEMFEGPTEQGSPVPGTTVTAIDRNRVTANSSTILVKKDPDVAADGTLINQARLGTTGNPATIQGGGAETRQEFVLNESTSYIIKFTPDANTTAAWIVFDWYEHTDSDA
jgi:hypothetical protein